jgi:hypothetical protein
LVRREGGREEYTEEQKDGSTPQHRLYWVEETGEGIFTSKLETGGRYRRLMGKFWETSEAKKTFVIDLLLGVAKGDTW